MAAAFVPGVRPPTLEGTAQQPPLFDGTTRLYTAYICPYAQRVWITRNYKGLEDEIKLVPLNLQDRPAWYKEKVHPANKVPALEHNGKVIGESLDLIKYIESNFEGVSLWPKDPTKVKLGEELLSYTDKFTMEGFGLLKAGPANGAGPFDHLEDALGKFDDGPFFLGEISLVDIAYIPFVERFQIYLAAVWNHNITEGRPKLASWIEAMNKIEAYAQTKCNPQEFLEAYKKRFSAQ